MGSDSAQQPLLPLERLLNYRVAEGPLAGAFRYAPGSYVNWYFASLALTVFAAEIPSQVRTYLELYLARLVTDAAGTLYAMDVEADLATPKAPDSHDSYAATFLSLTRAYCEATGDYAWFTSNRARIMDMAYAHYPLRQKPGGLVPVFQTGNATGYLMDNCEVYRGLDDLVHLLTATGQTEDAAYYGNVRDGVAGGVRSLGTGAGLHRVADDGAALGTAFYPDVVAQLWPQLFGVPTATPQTDARAARAFVTQHAPNWYRESYDQGFVWMQVGLAFARAGLAALPEQQLDLFRRTALLTPARATAHELAYAHLTRLTLWGR